jgi:hypothetical protein
MHYINAMCLNIQEKPLHALLNCHSEGHVRTSEVLPIEEWLFLTDISEQPIFPIFKPKKMGSVGCLETSVRIFHYPSCNFPEKLRSQLYRGGSL